MPEEEEEVGLLPPCERIGQRRHYPPASAERVALIRLCQDAGFTLSEIGRLLTAISGGRQSWGELTERTIAEFDTRIADPQRARKLIEHAHGCRPLSSRATAGAGPTKYPTRSPARPHNLGRHGQPSGRSGRSCRPTRLRRPETR